MNAIEFLIAPFIFIIKFLFQFGYSLTGNYGASIIFLSFSISLLLLPIFVLIEKAKKKDDAVKQKMKPLIDEIKRCYKGQERYYYIRTINRQHNYNPLKALIPILSLLLQIPFFIAAYQFLDNYAPLKGVSFLFIKNLSGPDALLGAINILPIAMTVVNLLTAYFYTRNGNSSERKQMLVVAGLFLILLFKLPAGLVLYWTMNNVFSFFRLFVTSPEVFRKISRPKGTKLFSIMKLKDSFVRPLPKFKITFISLSAIAILIQLNWAFKNNFNDILLRIVASVAAGFVITILIGTIAIIINYYKQAISKIQVRPGIYFSLLFLVIYYYLAGDFYYSGVNSHLSIISIILLIPLQIIGVLYVFRSLKSTRFIYFLLTLFLLAFVFICQILNLIVFFNGKEILYSILNINISVKSSTWSSIIISGILFSLISLPYYFKIHKVKFPEIHKTNWLIYILAVLYIAGLIFFWNPLLVYASSPETFDFPAIKIFANNLNVFFISIIIPLILFLILPKKIKRICLLFVLIIAAFTFIFSTLLPINLGSLQQSRFSEQEKLAAPIFRYVFESILIIFVAIGVFWLYRKQFFKIIIGTLILLNLLLIVQSLYKAIGTDSFFKTGREKQNTNLNGLSSAQLSENELKPIPFSKTQKNIVFFIADGYQGWFIKQIMEEDPGLKEIFKGFVWYPNTISIANYTHASLPSMLGGREKYSITKMNEDNEHTIDEKWRLASRGFIQKIKSLGYYYSSEYLHYADFKDSIVDNTIPYWRDSWKIYQNDIHLGLFDEIWYKRLYENAIFNSVPLFLKPKIYNNKKWLAYYSDKKTSSHWTFQWYNFIRLLPFISNNNSNRPNFIYIHNSAAHNPWNAVSESGEYINDVTPYENNKWFIQQLALWINWMKTNGVYENTKIIFISDHGPSWPEYDGKLDFDSPVDLDKDNPEAITDRQFWRLNPLLLVKDFGAQGSLKEDWRLMSNTDASSIVFDEKNPAKGIAQDRTFNTYWTFWASNMIDNKSMEIYKEFEVTGNMFELKNWKRVK